MKALFHDARPPMSAECLYRYYTQMSFLPGWKLWLSIRWTSLQIFNPLGRPRRVLGSSFTEFLMIWGVGFQQQRV